MTLYLHQRERNAPHTQSGYSLPEIKLRLSKLSWVTLTLSLGRLQSSTAPCGQLYKTILIVVPCILKNHSLLFYTYILATVRLDVKQLQAPVKCDQLSKLFPENNRENKTLTSWANFFALRQEPRSNIHCIGQPSIFTQVMNYQYATTLVKNIGKNISCHKI